VAVAFSIAWPRNKVEPRVEDDGQARDRLAGFRGELYRCLTARADELFELADAVLCADGPVKTLAGLSLAPEHRRGHGALYDAVSHRRMDIARLRVPNGLSVGSVIGAGLTAVVVPREVSAAVEVGWVLSWRMAISLGDWVPGLPRDHAADDRGRAAGSDVVAGDDALGVARHRDGRQPGENGR
jgi:hypothetical protein